MTLPRTQSASPGGWGPGTGQLKSGPSPPWGQMAQGPGPHLSLHQAPCPTEAWGRRLGHPTRHLRKTRSCVSWDSLCTPGPAAYLTHAFEDAWGAGLRTPNSGLWRRGRVRPGAQSAGFWPQGRSEHQNPVDQGRGGAGQAGGCERAEGGAETQAGLWQGAGPSVEEWGAQLPHPCLRSSEPCQAALPQLPLPCLHSAEPCQVVLPLPAGLGGLGCRP